VIARFGYYGSAIILAALLLANLYVQQYYVERSAAPRKARTASFVQIPDASASRLLDQLANIGKAVGSRDGIFVSDTSNLVLAKIEAGYAQQEAILFPSLDVFGFYNIGRYTPAPNAIIAALRPSQVATVAVALSMARESGFMKRVFEFRDSASGRKLETGFVVDRRLDNVSPLTERAYLLASGAEQSILNRSNTVGGMLEQVVPVSYNRFRNHLVFVDSERGRFAYAHSPETSLYGQEPDFFFPDETMAALGHYLLFEILNPTPTVRFVLSVTNTYRHDGADRLPPASIIGNDVQRLPLLGRGSARVISGPVKPRTLGNRHFVLLDMGVEGTAFPSVRTGLMALYGSDIPLDPRRVTCFGRDISVLFDSDVRGQRPPQTLSRFPRDLADPHLLYSGFYEDGWVAEGAEVTLRADKVDQHLRLAGLVPLLADANFRTTLDIAVDAHNVDERTLGPGYFQIDVPWRGAYGSHTIQLHFSRVQRLPSGDGRPAAALIQSIGFVSASRSR